MRIVFLAKGVSRHGRAHSVEWHCGSCKAEQEEHQRRLLPLHGQDHASKLFCSESNCRRKSVAICIEFGRSVLKSSNCKLHSTELWVGFQMCILPASCERLLGHPPQGLHNLAHFGNRQATGRKQEGNRNRKGRGSKRAWKATTK